VEHLADIPAEEVELERLREEADASIEAPVANDGVVGKTLPAAIPQTRGRLPSGQ